MPDDLDLDELAAKVAAMTPGPWRRRQWRDGQAEGQGYEPMAPGVVSDDWASPPGVRVNSRRDRNGIVALRNAAPALIAHARRVAALEAALGEALDQIEVNIGAEHAGETIARLRALLAKGGGQ